MSGEDLEGRNKVGEGNALVAAPLVIRVDVVNKDDKVVVGAFVVDLSLDRFTASHLGEV